MRPRTLPLVTLLALVALAAPGRAAAAAEPKLGRAERQALEERLPPEFRRWLAEVAPILTEEERDAFLKLEKDYQRDAFIRRFWAVRDPYPDTARNELKESWDARVAEAYQTFGELDEERARFFLLNGPPAVRMADRCGILLWPTEVWIYAPSPRVKEPLVLVFHQRSALGKWRLWMPSDGLAALFQSAFPGATEGRLAQELQSTCIRNDQFAAAILSVWRRGQFGYATLIAAALAPIEGPAREWVSTFAAYSTDLPEGAAALPGEIEIAFPGRRQSRTVVQATIAIPVERLSPVELEGHRSYNFLVNGEVVREGRLFDSFRYKFDLPAAEVTSAALPLVFERFLRPGTYTLIVRADDLNGAGTYRVEREIAVPAVEEVLPEPPDPETARLLAEANAALSTLDNTIQIVPPRAEMYSGLVRFDTLTTGPDIAEVQFVLDGKPILRKNRPPFSVELALGEVPATRTLAAIAFDAAGREIASDVELLNSSPHRFSVRLLEPRRGRKYESSLRAEAEVEIPEGETLERVEFWLNETLVATLYQEPFTQPIVLPPGGQVAYVRAVAYQVDGNSTEELVFVNAPENLDEIDVDFVELFTTVVGGDDRPVADLPEELFSVTEDGVPQTLVRFERLENLPIHAAVLLDVSASMEPNLSVARDAALQFFRDAIQPRDRAALIPFNDRPTLAVKMTNKLETLAGGLAGLKAERGTALYDSVVFGLFYFNGLKGQRAMLVLSDGKDENSRFTLDQTLDFARRAGVAIYTIGLDIPRRDLEVRRALKQLAEETGGRFFFIDAATELAPVYAAIQKELRSRYLLAYQSTHTGRDQKFRTVEVKVARPGLQAKTIRGYFP
jgi:Ca-activated chloride channel family protein